MYLTESVGSNESTSKSSRQYLKMYFKITEKLRVDARILYVRVARCLSGIVFVDF